MNAILARLASNKHTTGAAIAYGGIEALYQILAIWFPEHKEQMFETCRIASRFVAVYGFIMAGDSGKIPVDAPPK